MRHLLATGILALCCSAADPASGRAVHRFRTFTAADGLAHDIVRDVLEARDGTLWFATMGGVTRYDPRRCSYQTLADHDHPRRLQAMALAEAPDGAIWVATQGGGLGRYRAGSWRWYATRDGLPSDELSSVIIDRAGHLWATPTMGGVVRFDGRRWRLFGEADGLPRGEISRCIQRRSGRILCGAYDLPRLFEFDGRRWSAIPVGGAVRRHFYVHALVEAESGDLWLATKGSGVIQARAAPGGFDWVVHDSSHGELAGNRVGAITLARDGSLWFATSAGVSRFDGQRWQSFSRRDGLGSNQIFAITETRDGALWFATLGGGATRYGPSGWEQVGEAEGLASDNATCLLQTRGGELWVGTDQGLSVQRDGRWLTLRTGDTARDSVAHLLETRDSAVWVATRQGARRFTKGAWIDFPPASAGEPGPAHPVVTRLAQDREGRIWMATPAGVSRTSADGQRWRHYAVADGLHTPVRDILVDRDNRIWAATGNGVARLDGERWTRFLDPRPASRTNRIHSLVMDGRGHLWASGLEGVYRFDGARWVEEPPSVWLPAGIYSRFAMATADGSLWFAVRGLGVRRVQGDRWASTTISDGLAADTVSDLLQTRDGRFLFATLGGGLSLYRPDRHPPETFIGSIAGGAAGAPTSVVQGEDTLIGFAAQDHLKDSETAELLFSYRVDDGPWTPFSPETRAVLPRLRPGSHLFEVRAMDKDLNLDPSPARHRFRVVRHWWAEPWLLALVALSLLLGLYAGLRLWRARRRERAAFRQEQAAVEERRHFVRLASHELRKPLARLAHRAEMLLQPGGLTAAKQQEYTGAIAADSRELAKLVEALLEQSRIQAGVQLQLEPADLAAVVQPLLAELAGDQGKAPLRIPPAGQALPVRQDAFYLGLAIRNLLDNARKYGGDPDRIQVRLAREGSAAVLTVQDAGPGIPPEERQRIFEPFYRGRSRSAADHGGFGLGLSFARDIARAHGGDLELRASPVGARFCLSLPLAPTVADPLRKEPA